MSQPSKPLSAQYNVAQLFIDPKYIGDKVPLNKRDSSMISSPALSLEDRQSQQQGTGDTVIQVDGAGNIAKSSITNAQLLVDHPDIPILVNTASDNALQLATSMESLHHDKVKPTIENQVSFTDSHQTPKLSIYERLSQSFACFCFGRRKSLSGSDSYHSTTPHWLKSSTFRLVWISTLISVILLAPGLILYYSYPVDVFGTKALTFFSSLAIGVFIYPVAGLVLHLFFFHLLPESAFKHKKYGDWFYYAVQTMNYINLCVWLICVLLIRNITFRFVLPDANQDITSRVDGTIAVLILWVGVLGLKQAGMLIIMNRFQRSTHMERVRESLFTDYIVETMRAAKRHIKFMQKSSGCDRASILSHYHAVPLTDDLIVRLQNLEIPRSLRASDPNADAVQLGSRVTAYEWKKLLDHFYSAALTDEFLRDEIVEGDETVRLKRTKAQAKFTETIDHKKFHYLHQFNYQRKHRRMTGKRGTFINLGDEKAHRLSAKLYKLLRPEGEEFLEVQRDIMPLFDWKLISDSDSDSASYVELKQLAARYEKLRIPVQRFLTNMSDNGRFTEGGVREFIQRTFRERKRLVATLSGMGPVIAKINTFFTLLLCLILFFITLSIFGVNTVGPLVSMSSMLVSFAFLFGASARDAFESVVFLFLVHPYDVGDRIMVSGTSYLVTRVYLLSTVLERWDGQLIYVRNSQMQLKSIHNLRRSTNQIEVLKFAVAFSCSFALIDEFARKLNEYVAGETSDFEPSVSVSYDNYADLESFILSVCYTQKSNGQNYELYLARKRKFSNAMFRIVHELRIPWKKLAQPVSLLAPAQTSKPTAVPPSNPNAGSLI